MRVFPNGFGLIIGLISTFAISWIWPIGNGDMERQVSEFLSKISVFLIFLFQGLNLKLEQLKLIGSSISSLVRVHIFIFLVPLCVVLIFVFLDFMPREWLRGFVYLAILPTTISSCVVYTSFAGGNPDAALGHATLSNLLAIIWVPFAWLFLDGQSDGVLRNQWVSLASQVLPTIIYLIILPTLIGWMLRKKSKQKESAKFNKFSKTLSFGCILILVFLSLSECILLFGHEELKTWTIELLPVVTGFFICHSIFCWIGSGMQSVDRKLRIAEFYCTGQKSLAMGIPLLVAIYSNESMGNVGLLCIPLIIYHFLQLFLGVLVFRLLKSWALQGR